MTLYINACVRQDSRTRRLAEYLLRKLPPPVEEVRVWELDYPPMDAAFLQRRDALLAAGALDAPCFALARQFAAAEDIVVAAPYWDLSFPAALKCYFEQVNVVGLTFRYSPEGVPEGLCRAKRLYYVSTAGGAFTPDAYGFGYIKALAQSFYHIPDVTLIQAVGLDLQGAEVERLLQQAERNIDRLLEA